MAKSKKSVKAKQSNEPVFSFDDEPMITSYGSEKKSKKNNILIGCILVILILAIAGGSYYFLYYRHNTPSLGVQSQNQQANTIVSQVGQLMELPSDEQPTIATVTDVSKLSGEAFFAKAKNGDKVLIYAKAQKAILYDPAANKIVEVAPLSINTQLHPSQAAGISPTPSTVTVALDNGTTITGFAKTIEKKLTSLYPNVKVEQTNNAAKNNYTNTIVVDLSGNQQSLASSIATMLHGKVGELPNGELTPKNTNLLIILGTSSQ